MSEQVFPNCTTEGPIHVYVRDGKVVRIRPLVADEKDFKPWTIEAGGKTYTPRRNSISPPSSTRRGYASIRKTASSTR